MMLNMFYFVGVFVKNVIFGVSRLKEIINIAKSIKTLSLMIVFKLELVGDRMRVKDC